MTGFILVMSVIVIYLFISEPWLKKRYSVQKHSGILFKPINKTHLKAEFILLVIALPVIGFLAGIGFTPAIMIFFVLLYGLRVVMEWKYAKEKKQYILTLNGFVAFIVALAAATIFYFQG
ncbi:DUF4181 domain-containing protein [Lentibacillus sediminis]|uniref:DUF4181 domain-containing protein n=1 Tax=Lentibacillus sediminis TaxID=1940529 RepID=UPI000C1B9C14|nr:DUF4181 domain-containing protein [Lentibacillus sediminis]